MTFIDMVLTVLAWLAAIVVAIYIVIFALAGVGWSLMGYDRLKAWYNQPDRPESEPEKARGLEREKQRLRAAGRYPR